MNISKRTIKGLGKIITGDGELSPYQSGPQLVAFFNDFGSNDVYESGFPSRWQYVESKLQDFNGTKIIGSIIGHALDPREYMGTTFAHSEALENINSYLAYDGYEVILDNGRARIHDKKGSTVVYKHAFGVESDATDFIREQLLKAEEKITAGDYDGAITNARSLLEAVMIELEKNIVENAPKYNGDMPKLYKRVQKLLNIEPSRPDISGPLKEVLSGLVSIVGGISGASNRMGDRHARSYKPSKHHAVLVVNASKTLADFLCETHNYQESKNISSIDTCT
ncbi:abortive infection family protein [Granulosicoccus sp. 3-233]|uniref:abortive infection family protein n=1 Tax=Granulosicoccus sp. 3-233 TaxID=3417969 RepID=UPI003D353E03